MTSTSFLRLCLLPLGLTLVAFFLLPMVRLIVTGASGPLGISAYASILLEPRYRATLFNTVVLATATTVATLATPPSQGCSCSGIVSPAVAS